MIRAALESWGGLFLGTDAIFVRIQSPHRMDRRGLIVAGFRAENGPIRSADSGNANETFHPIIGRPAGGCHSVGFPERASRAGSTPPE
jgi:hypothetical protein